MFVSVRIFVPIKSVFFLIINTESLNAHLIYTTTAHCNSGRLNSTPKAASDKNQGKIDYWTEAIIYRIVMQVEDSSYSLVWLLLFSGGRDGSYTHVKTMAGGTKCKSSCSCRIGNPALKGLNSIERVCMYRDSIFRTSYNIGKLILIVTSWNTRRCSGLKIKWKKLSD
jgi:hypothetical protein